MDTYQHVIPGMQEEAAVRLQNLLFDPTPVTFPPDDENASRNNEERQQKLPVCRGLGARSAGLEPATFSVRSQTHSRTGSDREGHRETKQCFYRQLSTSKGTGTDRERHGVVVPLWYELAADLEFGLKLTRPARTTGF